MPIKEKESLPTGWKVTRVCDIVDPSRRVTYGIVQPGERLEVGVPMIRGQDYSSGTVDDSNLYLVHPQIAASYQRSTVQGGDILFSIVGYLGQTAIVPDHLTGANITQTTARIAVAPPNHNRFFLYQFQSGHFKPEVRKYQKGSAQPGLNLADVEKMLVVVPPPGEQCRIAEILDAADKAIRQTERLIAKLKAVKAGLLHDLLTRGLDEHGHLRDPQAHPEQFKDSPLGRIPKEWSIVRGEEAAELITKGESPRWQGFEYQEEGIVFITSENVREGYLDVSAPKFVSPAFDEKIRRARLRANDVLINLVGASIGRSCVVPEGIGPANINQAVCLFRPRGHVSALWILGFLQLPKSISRLLGEQVETARANISLGHIGNFLFPMPSNEEQERIAAVLDAHDTRIRGEEATLAKLRQVKRGLMDDLLTGRVRVV